MQDNSEIGQNDHLEDPTQEVNKIPETSNVTVTPLGETSTPVNNTAEPPSLFTLNKRNKNKKQQNKKQVEEQVVEQVEKTPENNGSSTTLFENGETEKEAIIFPTAKTVKTGSPHFNSQEPQNRIFPSLFGNEEFENGELPITTINTGKQTPLFSPTQDEENNSPDLRDQINQAPTHQPHVVIEELEEEANALGQLLGHHLKKQSKLNRKDVILGGAAFVIGVGSLTLYVNPTLEFAGDEVSHKILYLSSVLAANLGVSVYTSFEALKSFTSDLPVDLRKGINEHYSKNKAFTAVKIAGLGTLAILSAAPYALAADAAIWVRLIVGVTNTLMNYYGLNNLMFEHGKFLKNRFTCSEQNRAYHMLLDSFNHSVNAITNQVLKEGIVPNEFKPDNNLGPKDMLQFLASQAQDRDIQPYQPLTTTQLITRRLAPSLTGAALISGLGVYLLKTYENLHDTYDNDALNIPTTGVISVPFLYLAMTFSAKTMIDVADAVTCNGQKPLAMQLYPKTTWATMLALATVVSFSFATIADFVLNDKYFQEGGKLNAEKQFAVILAAAGAIIFNNYANQKLGFKIIEILARRFGSKKDLAHFGIEMQNFLNNVNGAMSAEAFIKSLGDLSEEDRIALLPMLLVNDTVETLVETANGNFVEDDKTFIEKLGESSRRALGAAYKSEGYGRLEKMPLEARKQHAKQNYGTNRPNQDVEDIQEVENLLERPQQSALSRFWQSLPSVNISNPFAKKYQRIEDDFENLPNNGYENK